MTNNSEIQLIQETGLNREHAEFHNAYQRESIKNDIRFLKAIYGDRMSLSPDDVTDDFLRELKSLGKRLYFFILGLTDHVTPSSYIKHKFNFLKGSVPGADPHLFYLAWNGLLRNDSFKRILQQKFSLKRFNDLIVPRNIPAFGSRHTRYRTKLVLAVEDLELTGGRKRNTGRILDDGTGNLLQEGIVWLPNGKGLPLYPDAYVAANQTQMIVIRHGKSVHESGGDNPGRTTRRRRPPRSSSRTASTTSPRARPSSRRTGASPTPSSTCSGTTSAAASCSAITPARCGSSRRSSAPWTSRTTPPSRKARTPSWP